MKNPLILISAFVVLSLGWFGAFLLANSPTSSQSYWLFPALIIGVGTGLVLRITNGRRTALTLAITALVGLGAINHYFPERRVTTDSIRSLFQGVDPRGSIKQLQVPSQLNSAPFNINLPFTSPVALEISLYNRFPAGVEDFCFSPDNDLYASLPRLGAVYKVNQLPQSSITKPELFLHGLDNPTGLTCTSTQLLVAESSRIKSYNYQGEEEKLLVDHLPDDGGELVHRLLMGPEGLFFSVGSRCDACKEKEPLRATLQLLKNDGTLQTYNKGLRKIGGLTINQTDNSIWASENSRQYPPPGAPDEINSLKTGDHYGWPMCDGGLPDSTLKSECKNYSSPEQLLLNRANPAGLMVTTQLNYPQVYRNSLLVVLQGDPGNKTLPAIVRLPLSGGELGPPVAFLAGWDGITARPAAIHPGPDSAIYIGDVINGAIYRAAWLASE